MCYLRKYLKMFSFEDFEPIIFIVLYDIICIFKLYCYQKSVSKGYVSWSAIFFNDETYIVIIPII